MLSTRQASITISWLADRNATRTAKAAIRGKLCFGLHNPRPRIAPIRRIWMVIPQPRRRPNGSGGGTRSISGAHRNLNA